MDKQNLVLVASILFQMALNIVIKWCTKQYLKLFASIPYK